MATQKGKYVVWGIGTSFTSGAITDCYFQSISSTLSGKEKEIVDGTGETKTLIMHDDKYEITIEVIPNGGSTSTEAAAAANLKLPARGAKVVIADTLEGTPAAIAGNWIFTGGSVNKTNEGEARISMNLRRYSTDIA